jgi:hypothetical protein
MEITLNGGAVVGSCKMVMNFWDVIKGREIWSVSVRFSRRTVLHEIGYF